MILKFLVIEDLLKNVFINKLSKIFIDKLSKFFIENLLKKIFIDQKPLSHRKLFLKIITRT